MFYHERTAQKKGLKTIVGVDEVGRGSLAGPVVASAVVITNLNFKEEINDSKKLTPAKRLKAYRELQKKAIIGIGIVGKAAIDRINIYQATIIAMEKAIAALKLSPNVILIDGNVKIRSPYPKKNIKFGDSKSISIAAASIIAKVTRDRIMIRYHKKFPQYEFDKHKGYGTAKHIQLLFTHGPCPIHRRSFHIKKSLSLS